MFLIDTSVIVALLAREADWRAIREWLGERERDLAITQWATTEFASAMSAKVREGVMQTADRLAATQALDRLVEQALFVAPVQRRHFEEAARLCSRNDVVLRAPDALHIAVALEHAATLVTRDKGMAAAARTIGLKVETP
jgi:predicted nucleic acid-binding protein